MIKPLYNQEQRELIYLDTEIGKHMIFKLELMKTARTIALRLELLKVTRTIKTRLEK